MTLLLAHRRNTREELRATPVDLGVEIDLRSDGDRLVLHHDPFQVGTSFRDWLQDYRHAALVLNVKEDGLESTVLQLLEERGVERYFFLDQAFPTLRRWALCGERRCAVRVSEHEPVEAALAMAGMVDWAWVDCFTRYPLSGDDAARLRAAGFQLCLVSPELQGRTDPEEIVAYARLVVADGGHPEAVCTKRPDLWSSVLSLPA